MKKGSIILTCIILIGIIFPISTIAYSFVGRWQENKINYYFTGNAPFQVGAGSWSGLDAGFTYSNTYYGVNGFVVYEPDVFWDGRSSVGKDALWIQTVTIMINSGKSQTWNNSEALKSVVVHEFGHALGLNENGTTMSIMNASTWGTNSRYGTYKLTVPQADDKNGINSMY